MGTSLVVNPFASLVGEVDSTCPRALFNLEKVGVKRMINLARLDPFYRESGFDFASERDTFCQGYVDDTVRLLARECGWEKELDAMHAETMKRLDDDVDALTHAMQDATIEERRGQGAGPQEAKQDKSGSETEPRDEGKRGAEPVADAERKSKDGSKSNM